MLICQGQDKTRGDSVNLYFVVRWGNTESEEGPDGEDTNFMVCARSVENAAVLVDERLKSMPTRIRHNRPVQPFSHGIIDLGTAPALFNHEIILCGPWIAFELMSGWPKGLPCWRREVKDGDWEPWQDGRNDCS